MLDPAIATPPVVHREGKKLVGEICACDRLDDGSLTRDQREGGNHHGLRDDPDDDKGPVGLEQRQVVGDRELFGVWGKSIARFRSA